MEGCGWRGVNEGVWMKGYESPPLSSPPLPSPILYLHPIAHPIAHPILCDLHAIAHPILCDLHPISTPSYVISTPSPPHPR